MAAIFIYLGKVILTSGLMFGYYQLLLKDKTFHHYNRFYLLATLVVSLLLPLLKVNYFTLQVTNDVYLLLNKLQPVSKPVPGDLLSVPGIITLALALISVLLAARFFYGIFKILKLKRRFPREQFKGLNFYQTDLGSAPFSYFRNLFWRNNIPLHSELGAQILKHEMAHIEQKHTYDKILIETIRAVFWFNPFFHLIKKEIHLIHEYLADHKAIKKSDTKAFAQMLLASHFSGDTFPAASPLLNVHLKKRLQMIQTSKTKFSYARKTLALPLLFSMAFACVVHAQNSEIKATNTAIARAVRQIGKTTVTTAPGIDIRTGNDKVRSEESGQPDPSLQQTELKTGNLQQQIRQIEQSLETLDPASQEAAVKFDQLAVLSEKISDLVVNVAVQETITVQHDNNVVHYTNVLSKEEKREIREAAARAEEEAEIAVNEAASARAAAALMQQEAAQARVLADVAREEAAAARAEAALMQQEATEAKVAADVARKAAAAARREAARRIQQVSNH